MNSKLKNDMTNFALYNGHSNSSVKKGQRRARLEAKRHFRRHAVIQVKNNVLK